MGIEDELLTKDSATLARENRDLKIRLKDSDFMSNLLYEENKQQKKDITSALKSIEALAEAYLRLAPKKDANE